MRDWADSLIHGKIKEEWGPALQGYDAPNGLIVNPLDQGKVDVMEWGSVELVSADQEPGFVRFCRFIMGRLESVGPGMVDPTKINISYEITVVGFGAEAEIDGDELTFRFKMQPQN